MFTSEINLLRSKTRYSAEFAGFLGQLRKFSYLAIILTVILGIGTAGLFFYLQFSLSALSEQQSQLLVQVNANARKEALYRSIKAELGIAAKVLDLSKSWKTTSAEVLALAPAPAASSFTVDDLGSVSLTVNTESIEEAAGVVSSVQSLVSDNQLKNPVLENFEVNKSGGVRMLLSFTPVFP